jgi:hypothetical protein
MLLNLISSGMSGRLVTMARVNAANTGPLTDDVRWGILQRKTQEVRACRAFELFRQRGIEPILIKGLAAAMWYPPDVPRLSIDMDLAVSREDFPSAENIAAEGSLEGLAIDVHSELRHLDTVPWLDLFSNSVLLKLDGYDIRVLRPEDHLRVVCVHWMTDGGREKKKLWDIHYMVANRPADFDWQRCLDTVPEHRRRWLICALGLASRYTGLDLVGTPVENEAPNLPDWLIRTVENEWSGDPLIPMEVGIFDLKNLPRQIAKRLRPNPLWSTIHMEGSLDARTRAFYQIGSFFKRIIPSYRRVSRDVAKTLR